MEFHAQPLAWIVKPKGADLFSERATTITRTDDGAGQYLTMSQCNDIQKPGEVTFDADEWPAIKQAIETAFCEILADELTEPTDTPQL